MMGKFLLTVKSNSGNDCNEEEDIISESFERQVNKYLRLLDVSSQ